MTDYLLRQAVLATYAAYRVRADGCSAASIGLSFIALDSWRDPFALGYSMLKHTKKVATSDTSPNTIPQYTSDICHTLACEPRESLLLTLSRGCTIHPHGAVVLHLA